MRLQKGTPKITHGNKGWNPDMEVLKGWYCASEVGVSGFQVGTRPGDFLEFFADSPLHGFINSWTHPPIGFQAAIARETWPASGRLQSNPTPDDSHAIQCHTCSCVWATHMS